MILSVSDLVRLATAGVKVDLSDHNLVVNRDEDLPHVMAQNVFPASLVDAFWDRWHRAHVNTNNFPAGRLIPYAIYAHEFAETVYVMVCPVKQPPFIIEDHARLYPSDALMAKLALYESTNP